MSSRSSQKAMRCWPRPMVYFPGLTLSKVSSSDCSTNYGLTGEGGREEGTWFGKYIPIARMPTLSGREKDMVD